MPTERIIRIYNAQQHKGLSLESVVHEWSCSVGPQASINKELAVVQFDIDLVNYLEQLVESGKALVYVTGTQLSQAEVASLKYAPVSDAAFSVGPANKEVFFPAEYDADLGNHRVAAVVTDGTKRFEFAVPGDFTELVSLDLIGTPGGAFTDQDIDLAASYGAVGEALDAHTGSDTTTLYSGAADVVQAIDLSGVFSEVAAGDICGVLVTHNLIGVTINYSGVRLVYR